MARKIVPPTFEQVQQKLASLGMSCTSLSGGNVLARKYDCAAVLAPANGGKTAEIAVPPGRVVNGELARLIDRGYQKFFKSADAEIPARPEELSALARFENEVRFACGIPSLYNEALGSVSDRYIYDRIWFRDEGRQPKPWEQEAATALRA